MQRYKRFGLAAGVIAAWLGSSFSAYGIASATPFDIEAGSAPSTLKEFATQAHIQLLFDYKAVQSLKTPAIKGDLDPSEALRRLLLGTGFTFQQVNAHTIAIKAPSATSENPGSENGGNTGELPLLSQSNPATPARTNVLESSPKNNELQEVVVTAQKRNERVQDVPMSLTALSGDALDSSHSFQFEDYVGRVPGLTLIATNARINQLVIRGITTGSNGVNGSVATYIDETPYIAEGPIAVPSSSAPNLDTFDMQRIEVLRGPQGTLYGANALGGLLKYVTNAPDPSGFAARVEAGGSSVNNGGAGFDTHAMVNLPLAADTALRLVGYDTYYPGFIDDPSRGFSDINGSRFTGGRASLLWSPSSNFSIRLNALYQNRDWNDYPNEDVGPNTLTPIYGNFKQVNLINQPGQDRTQIYNATINADLGFAKLVSASSYSNNQWRIDAVDYTKQFGAFLNGLPGSPYGFDVSDVTTFNGVTQELRLSSDTKPLQWQVGGYLTNQNSTEFQPYYPIDISTRSILYNYPTNVGSFYIPVHYHEYAGFADLDYHFTPTFDAAIGGRYSTNNQTFHETGAGLFGAGIDIANRSSQGVFTFSGDLRWHFTPDNMVYGRIAKGFVPGGPNNAIPNAVVKSSYDSSTTLNYEIGLKSEMLDNTVSFDVSIFDIEWQRIQLVATIGGFNTTTNGGAARSDGFEWSANYVPVRGLTLNLNGAYTDARLTEPTPASIGASVGSRLPSVPLWETSFGAEYDRTLTDAYSGFAGLNWRFMGNRYADFEPTGPRQQMPAFEIVDLRTGFKVRNWSVSLYVKNVGNKIAINYLTPETLSGALGPQSASLYTPRTVGMSVAFDF